MGDGSGSQLRERTAGGGGRGGQSCTVPGAPGEVPRRRLFHATAQHLIGRDEHDADDEGDGEGANQTLAHARLADLLVGAGCGHRTRETEGNSRVMESEAAGTPAHGLIPWGTRGHRA